MYSKKWLYSLGGIAIALFCTFFLIQKYQEKLIFYPIHLDASHEYRFSSKFDEIIIPTLDGKAVLNCVLFHSETDTTKGVVLFFHGNSGNNQGWGHTSGIFTQAGYDVLYYDYRGFGKSSGTIKNEKELITDGIQLFEYLNDLYVNKKIVLSGTSIGTGIAIQVAHSVQPSALFLNAPFYSLKHLVKEKTIWPIHHFLNYNFRTDEVIGNLKCSIVIFHGINDKIIPSEHSRQLKKINKNIRLHLLENCGHNDFFGHDEFKVRMEHYLISI